MLNVYKVSSEPILGRETSILDTDIPPKPAEHENSEADSEEGISFSDLGKGTGITTKSAEQERAETDSEEGISFADLEKGTEVRVLKIENIRQANWCIRMLEAKDQYIKHHDGNSSLVEKTKAIDDLIVQWKEIKGRKTRFIQQFMEEVDRFLVPEKELSWLDKNDERQMYWLWMQITNRLRIKASNYDIPNSSCEIYDSCIQFLDNWGARYVAESRELRRDDEKIYFISRLRLEWRSIFNSTEKYKFIKSKNEIQSVWALEYIRDRSVERVFRVDSQKERYLHIIAFFDSWNVREPDGKELFIIRMKKAWSQKLYRDKLVDYVICNITIKKATKAKLDKLAENNDKKLNETIAWLIESEFKNRIYSKLSD